MRHPLTIHHVTDRHLVQDKVHGQKDHHRIQEQNDPEQMIRPMKQSSQITEQPHVVFRHNHDTALQDKIFIPATPGPPRPPANRSGWSFLDLTINMKLSPGNMFLAKKLSNNMKFFMGSIPGKTTAAGVADHWIRSFSSGRRLGCGR
jgi:hypothetical protein